MKQPWLLLLLVGWVLCATYAADDIFVSNPDRGYMRTADIGTSGCTSANPDNNGVCASPDSGWSLTSNEGGVTHRWYPLVVGDTNLNKQETSSQATSKTIYSPNPYRSVVWRNVYMDSKVAALPNIPSAIINGLATDFTALRTAGFKAYYRFAYARLTPRPFAGTDFVEPNDINVIKTHISQLAAVINANKDLVVGLNMGMLGYYGEGHWWDELCSCEHPARPAVWTKNVTEAWLYYLDPRIQITLRYPEAKSDHYTYPVLDANTPFDSPQRRMGFHNDCFLSSNTDVGTFARGSNEVNYVEGSNTVKATCNVAPWTQSRFTSKGIACDRDYVKAETAYTHMMGETCDIGRTSCTSLQYELDAYHFSLLNIDYNQNGYQLANRACHDVIRKSIGYRLEIVSFDYTASTGAYSFVLKNTGYARMINNKRIVLSVGAAKFVVPTDTLTTDMRNIWRTGTTYSGFINRAQITAAANIFIAVTDIGSVLRDDIKYNVRFSSAIPWNVATASHDTGILASPGGSPPPAPVPVAPVPVPVAPVPVPVAPVPVPVAPVPVPVAPVPVPVPAPRPVAPAPVPVAPVPVPVAPVPVPVAPVAPPSMQTANILGPASVVRGSTFVTSVKKSIANQAWCYCGLWTSNQWTEDGNWIGGMKNSPGGFTNSDWFITWTAPTTPGSYFITCWSEPNNWSRKASLPFTVTSSARMEGSDDEEPVNTGINGNAFSIAAIVIGALLGAVLLGLVVAVAFRNKKPKPETV